MSLDRHLTEEMIRMMLESDGAFPPGFDPEELNLLILSAFPQEPSKATGERFIPAEFVGDLEENVLARIEAIAAANPQREAALAARPPTPDEKAVAIAEAAAEVRKAVRACFVGMRLKKPKIIRDGEFE